MPQESDAAKPRWRGRRAIIHLLSRAEPNIVLAVARRAITHRPNNATSARRNRTDPSDDDRVAPPLYVCGDYAQTGVCPRGRGCPDVHADLTQAQRLHPHHRRPAYHGLPPHMPPRLPASLGMLPVAPANETTSSLRVAAADCLVTRALEVGRYPLSVCAHFVRKGVCDYGAQCQFVHPVVDPESIAAAPAQPTDGPAGDARSDAAECGSQRVPPFPVFCADVGDAAAARTPASPRSCDGDARLVEFGPAAPAAARQASRPTPARASGTIHTAATGGRRRPLPLGATRGHDQADPAAMLIGDVNTRLPDSHNHNPSRRVHAAHTPSAQHLQPAENYLPCSNRELSLSTCRLL
uniref:C3H1-type domain-containing protein n=1 Tax=Neobodo designis TaxID=312471 RepID=A0A7S1LXM3_NEODS|mmetsp:Transcript_30045/g.92700  ORF Transcript_30045/g.92700 Transcript_30045/m.92700 type:complete len:352 (+) Transcript_30045:126-1181(+)|eukprot:CAMPEP_0174856340 /NCGR_PEP_ID=MMETSP1114-20130205/35695_1 /TAXON_ID=312471 /ORGANISM="Neobodo designis, Strain CCAP 1951/1" /LENGTH=351 /DNA_ID=CAMNT_0016091135 /DNA_START=98 /DNA_END=1153 /DNA_ORIENTATION=+